MRISDWSSDVCSSDLGIGRPAMIGDAVAFQRRQRLLRIAHAIDVERELRLPRRAEEVILQLGGTLPIAPVADPDEAAFLTGQGTEMPCVGGFMPSPDALAPAPASIDFRQIGRASCRERVCQSV